MKITTLVENTTISDLKPVHGLAFYIETKKHKLLFDLGPDDTIFENAKKKGIDLSRVDTVVISHGHFDHGGALKHFLELNGTARVYIQRSAYEPHYSKNRDEKKFIGLDETTMAFANIVLVDGDLTIDDELSLFVSKVEDSIKSEANRSLYGPDGPDDFRHEQNLLIHEEKNVLVMGCGHSGVISILKSIDGPHPAYCLGGFHVYDPVSRRTVSEPQLQQLAQALEEYRDVQFYTGHCTGTEAFDYLSSRFENVNYIACGQELEI